MSAAEELFETIRGLFRTDPGPLRDLLPVDAPSLAGFYERLKGFVAAHPRSIEGTVDPQAIVRGEIVSLGKGSVIEAGAVIHESCRLVLGAGSRVRAGAVLRDEVVVGDGCLVGVHCEVFRSVLLGPGSYLGHRVLMADSVAGRDVMVAGGVIFASSTLHRRTVGVRLHRERVETGRSHLGALVGDGVRLGASVLLCPGCVVQPGLVLPPRAVLLGVIDERRRDALARRFLREWGDDEGGDP